jgi:predicted CoA-binding protein
MQDLIKDAVNQKVWALVGATNDSTKYGNIIFKNMRNAGYTVYPINPRATTVEGVPAYPNLAALPERPAVVDIVIPPSLVPAVLEEAAALGISTVWMQPGAESQEAVDKAAELGLNAIYNYCAMVEKRIWR